MIQVERNKMVILGGSLTNFSNLQTSGHLFSYKTPFLFTLFFGKVWEKKTFASLKERKPQKNPFFWQPFFLVEN